MGEKESGKTSKRELRAVTKVAVGTVQYLMSHYKLSYMERRRMAVDLFVESMMFAESWRGHNVEDEFIEMVKEAYEIETHYAKPRQRKDEPKEEKMVVEQRNSRGRYKPRKANKMSADNE